MGRLVVPLLACVALIQAAPLFAADDPKALVEKAIKAKGGAETLEQCTAVRTRYTGHFGLELGADSKMSFKGEMYEQRGGQVRMSFSLDLNGTKMDLVMVSNGDKSWQSMNGAVSESPFNTREYQEQVAYQERVTRLLPLLQEKGFTLTALGESKVEDRAVLGVKVSCKDKPDVSLFFDKETGLLTKYAIRQKQPGLEKEVLTEVVHLKYQEINLAAEEEATLKGAKVATDGPELVKYLRGLIPDAANVARVKGLIKKLGDDSFEVREKATEELVKIGRLAVPLLQQATKDDDREVSRRAEDCLQRIGEKSGTAAIGAAVRLLALKRPAGAVEALLDYLPAAEEPVVRDIKAALVILAQRDGKPDPALTKALDDKDALRRKVAAAVLGKDGGAYLKDPGRRIYPHGLKVPMKTIHYNDGKKSAEMDVVEVQFFNRFEDKLFDRP